MRKNIVLKRTVRCIAFLLVFALLFSYITLVFLPKWTCREEIGQVAGFYEEEKDTIDVLGFGSCNMYSSFSPVIMYEKYGITGYNLCCPDEELRTSYYFLREALKTQDPKVVVIESLFFTETNNSRREHYNRFAMDYLPLSLNKIRFAWELSKSESELMQKYDSTAPDTLLTFFGYLFPLLRYHGKTDIEESDYTYFFNNDLYNFYKGGFPQYTYTTNDGNFFNKVFNGSCINDTTKEYFPKIVDLCEENGIELIVIKSPNYARWGYDDEQTKLVRDYVTDYGITFVDFHSAELNNFEEYDYGYSTGRLNVYGMNRLSVELGSWLSENLGLTATDLDAATKAKWDECVEQYYAVSEEEGCNIYPGQIAQLKNNETGITVRWNAVEDAKTYKIYRCNGKAGSFELIADQAEGVEYYDYNLTAGQGYSYYIVPNEGTLAGIPSDPEYYVFVAPPSNVSIYNDDGIIRYSWDAADGAQTYRIHRRADTDFNFEIWERTENTSTYNSIVTQGEMYYFRICSVVTEDDESYYSTAVIVNAVSQVDPRITSCSDKNGSAQIKWDAISGCKEIKVWRCDTADGTYELIDTLDSSATQYTDETVEKGHEYFYQLSYTSKNLDNITESAPSNTVSIKIRK